MAEHSKIGASSMKRWKACPGSVRLSEGLESRTSKYADEGTCAHEVAAKLLLEEDVGGGVSDEMLEAVLVYVNYCRALPADVRLVEHRFDLSSIHPGLFGTADYVGYDSATKTLRVVDYKHGAGIPVDVVGNEQLMYYGLGALLSLDLPCQTVELTIVQPRCEHPDGPIRAWAFPASELLEFAHDVKILAMRTENIDAPLVPGEHCRFCPAAGVKCPEVEKQALAVAQAEFRNDLPYDPASLAKTLHALPILEAYVKKVREFAYGEALHGRTPPGFKLVEKRAVRRWKDADDAARTLEEYGLTKGEIYHQTTRSPAQVEKLLSNKRILDPLVTKESSGFALAPEDDKRPAVRPDAEAEFSKIPTEE